MRAAAYIVLCLAEMLSIFDQAVIFQVVVVVEDLCRNDTCFASDDFFGLQLDGSFLHCSLCQVGNVSKHPSVCSGTILPWLLVFCEEGLSSRQHCSCLIARRKHFLSVLPDLPGDDAVWLSVFFVLFVAQLCVHKLNIFSAGQS